jgi:hypothetical protein
MTTLHALRQKLFKGVDALDSQDINDYLGAILWLQYYQRDYGRQKAIRLLDEACEEWSKVRGCCAYCGECGAYHDPRGSDASHPEA